MPDLRSHDVLDSALFATIDAVFGDFERTASSDAAQDRP